MNSSQTLYEGEKRAVEITIRANDDTAYSPSAATVEIKDSDGDTIESQDCMIVENRVYCYIRITRLYDC